MQLSNAHKALIITILLTSSVVLMAFNFHIRKKNEQIFETYYEFLEEDDEFLKEKEELAEILKSFDDLNTNRAFNETKDYKNQDDPEFEETMERLKNRHDNEEAYEAKSYESADDFTDNSSFNEINKIIEKRGNNDSANTNSTMSYSLVDRDLLNNPTPIYLCEYGGTVVISIEVDSKGRVTNAQYNTASGTNNGCLVDHALEYAKAAIFSSDAAKATQIGTITFHFRGKQ